VKDINALLGQERYIKPSHCRSPFGYHVALKVADFVYIGPSFDMDEEGRLQCSLHGKAR